MKWLEKNKEEIIDVVKRRREKSGKEENGVEEYRANKQKKKIREKNGSMTQGNKFYENN